MREIDTTGDQDPPLADDPVGAGTGGSPVADDAAARAEAAQDPEVAAMVRALRGDMAEDPSDVRADVSEASEQVGTGTDR